VLKGMEQRIALLGGQIQLSRAVVGNVDGNDSVDLLTVRLNGNCCG
jgi:glucose-6-phosphate-specific signal transduction histidine kinase